MAAIEYLAEFQISKSDLDDLDVDVAAALGVVCHAFNEMNVLLKTTHYYTNLPITEFKTINVMTAIHQEVLLRILSAKVFEFQGFLNFKKRGKIDDGSSNRLLLTLGKSALENFNALKADPTYKLVKYIRNETTNHYTMKPAKKNLKFVHENSKLPVVRHDIEANSFSPLGEEIMFFSRLARAGIEVQNEEELIDFLIKWHRWNIEAVLWVQSVYNQFIERILNDSFPEIKVERTDFWLPEEMVGEVPETTMPLFVRMSNYDRAKEKVRLDNLANNRQQIN